MGALVVPGTPTPKPELESRLGSIKSRIENLKVTDKLTYTEMLQAKKDLQDYIKAVGFELDPGIAKAKELLDLLKQQKAKFVDPAESIIEQTAKPALKAWIDEEERKRREDEERQRESARRDQALRAEQERIAAENEAAEKKKAAVNEIRGKLSRKEITKREAEKLLRMAGANEEADKAAAAAQAEEKANAPAPKIEVKSDIPAVAGTRRSRTYKFKIVDAAKVPREWCEPDLVKIGAEVRRIKDSVLAAALIPGIKTWDEPSI